MQNCNFTCGFVWVCNFLTLWEGHRLRVSENMVPRLFGPNKEEVTGGWKKNA
jgi:hypothetical protein